MFLGQYMHDWPYHTVRLTGSHNPMEAEVAEIYLYYNGVGQKEWLFSFLIRITGQIFPKYCASIAKSTLWHAGLILSEEITPTCSVRKATNVQVCM